MSHSPLAITHQQQAGVGRFEARVDGQVVELDYLRRGEQLIFHHTGTDPALQGRGLAGQMVEHALRWAAPQGLQLQASCSYVAAWLQRHPAWRRLLAPAAAQRVLNFWFDAPGGPDDGQVRSDWFRKNADFDARIGVEFGLLIEQALAGGLQDWLAAGPAEPWSRLAYIVLLDQLTRNHFRGEARAFAGDARALPAALALLDGGRVAELPPLQRWFALMPLEHAEDLALQQRCVREFEALAAEDARLDDALDYARRHLAVIAQFGRFPHRNAPLGRESSAAEQAYLARPGSGF